MGRSNNFRIHIVPVGFDPIDRVTFALEAERADDVYLVSRAKEDDAKVRMAEIEKRLAQKPSIRVNHVYVPIWDLFSCLAAYREIFETEKGNHIYVNVSTGSKIQAIAGMLACMLWGGTPYYARLDYEKGGPSISADKREVAGIDFLPVYQINMPTLEALRVLSIIGKKQGSKISKKELIEELQESGVIPKYGPTQPRNAPHSRLKAILDPLEDHWKFVEVKSKGRTSEVSLTRQGINALRIFGSGNP
jgi:hypothetical protein